MKRVLRWLGISLALVLGVPLLVLGLLAAGIAIAPEPPATPPGRAIPGVFHVHAEGSHDGFGTLAEAAAAAKKSGARFLVLTEHNRIRPALPEVMDGVLIVPGVEISAKAGHVIALGLSEIPKDRGPGVVDRITQAGGDAILAHPVNRKRPWSDPSPDGFVGFEGLSLDSAFRTAKAAAPWRLVLALAALVGDSDRTGAILMERPDEALARYDELAAKRPVALLCGVDAHGLPPYGASFGALRLHLFATFNGDPAHDAAAVREAIREGRTFCSVPALGDASGLEFRADRAEALVRIDRPDATLVLFRDGAEVARGSGPELRVPGGPGSWRAEVRVAPGFPHPAGALWIATSAIRVGEAAGTEHSAER